MHIIRLLGVASVERSNGTSLGRAIQRVRMAMLATLALSRTRTARRDRLMALLWPEHGTDRARHLLRESLYRLRETLGDDVLLTSGDEIRLNGVTRCDVWEFEEAVARRTWAEADRLYTGPLLDGFFLNHAPEFEQWIGEERARLAKLHAQAIESHAIESAASADWSAAVRLWQRRVAEDPFNARVVLGLMEALDASGDRGAALQLASTHGTLLKTELGAAPDPAVAAFAERLRREPALWEPTNHGNGSGGTGPPVILDMTPVAASPAIDKEESNVGLEPPVVTTQRRWFSIRTARRRSLGSLVAVAAVLLVAAFAGMRVLRAEPALDPNRIAIMPVRVSGADQSLAFLRDGLVELLALYFTGDVGPAAVDPGQVLAAWHRSGKGVDAGAREAVKVARELGAGQVSSAALVGTPDRFTLTMSVLAASDGSTRVTPIQIEGSIDRFPAVAFEMATRLRAHYAGADIGTLPGVNAEVLRLYVDGMSEYRKARWVEAGDRLFRAFELDSTFLPAGYRFSLIHALVAPIVPLGIAPARFRAGLTPGQGGLDSKQRAAAWLYRVLWGQRQDLPTDQRLLLESVMDSVNIRWHQEQLPGLERTVTIHRNSAEAWELLGDAYYHAGQVTGHGDWSERSKLAFARALTLDPAIAIKAPGHLSDLAFIDGDRGGHEHFARLANEAMWIWENPTVGPSVATRGPMYRRYQAAILRGRPATVRAARIEYSRAWARGDEAGPEWALRGMTLPPNELDALLGQMEADATTDSARRDVHEWLAHAAAMSGRPARARELLRRALLDGPQPPRLQFLNDLVAWAEDDSAAAEEMILLARQQPITGEMKQHPPVCEAALSRLRRGDTTGVEAILASEAQLNDTLGVISAWKRDFRRGRRAQGSLCALVGRGVLAAINTGELSSLLRADSLMRVMPLNYADWWNYDVALALARHGEFALAAAAARRHFHDAFPLQRLALRLRQEGRWAAAAGDTVAALKAYRHYLIWRADPEPVLIPQRDSVRAELAALERTGWIGRVLRKAG